MVQAERTAGSIGIRRRHDAGRVVPARHYRAIYWGKIMTKEIPLTQGKVALVDDEDYPTVIKYRWCAVKDTHTFYALRNILAPTGKRHNIRMHRMILNLPEGVISDHINGNGLDNRRKNLQIVTNRQNCQNKHTKKSSRYPGVSWNKSHRKWVANIRVGCKIHYLGDFDQETKAHFAYQYACNWISSDGLIESGPEQLTGVTS